MRSFLTLVAVAFFVPLAAHAGTPVPEIDAGSAMSALALVSGAVFVVTSRRARR